MSNCSRYHSQYSYHAFAYGLSGEVERPVKQSIDTQASAILSSGGGRGTGRVQKFSAPPFVSFEAAYCEVGGSFDECHKKHTTFAHAVIEGLNIADVIKADKVVARLAIYSPVVGSKDNENSFDITGSHFENLRIAGHRLDVKLATHRFHDCHTYSALENEYEKKSADDLLCQNKLSQQSNLRALEDDYHALTGLADAADEWKKNSKKRTRGNEVYWCSAANDLEKHFGKDSEIQGFGCFVCIPKFGVVRLAEVIVHKNYRMLNMVRVQMCSTGDGSIHGGGTGGNGTPMPPN